MKKILVLDIDETLLNIEPLFFLKKFKKNYKTYKGKPLLNKYYLSPRPNLIKFLKKAKEKFQLIAFSIADKDITIKKLQTLNILNYFTKIYGKQDLENGKKSLKKVARDLNTNINNITAIDDTPEHFIEQENIIKIKPWYIGDSKQDTALLTTFFKI